jgi:hypothetical protein
MPSFGMTADRWSLLIAGGAALLVIILTAALGPSTPGAEDSPTTYSTRSNGAKALYSLLQESGYDTVRWEQPAADLGNPATTTLILAEPSEPPSASEIAAIDTFIQQGGHVIATGQSGASFLKGIPVVPDPIAGLTWKRIPGRSPSLVTRAAPDITLAPRAFWIGEGSGLALYSDADDARRVRVVKASAGLGEVMWWASSTPLTNVGSREPGNLEFVLASVAEPGRRIAWDEFVHGHRRTARASVLASPFAWTALPLLVMAAAVLATYARRSGPIVVPAVENRLSPLEFARTLGTLYQRANAAAVPVDTLYQGLRFRLSRRVGIAVSATPEDLAHALRSQGLDAAGFETLMQTCESARHDPRLSPSVALMLTQSLHDAALRLNLLPPTTKEPA